MDSVDDLKRRFANAQRRACYWSGMPSFHRKGFSPRRNNSGEASNNYEMAMCDCMSLADAIEEAGGVRPVIRDYVVELAERWAKFIRKVPPQEK